MAELEASPDSPEDCTTFQAQIAKRLKADPALAAELEALLAEAGKAGYDVSQTMTVTGDRNVTALVAGEGNVTNIGGRD